METEVDSLGNYSVALPAGNYKIELPDAYFQSDNKVYATGQKKPILVAVKAGQKTSAPKSDRCRRSRA